MWVYQETPETAVVKALPEAIMPTAQEEPVSYTHLTLPTKA